jgi:hypothetical protein
MLITIKQYAELHQVDPSTIRHRIQRGSTKAQKVGRDWLIEEEEPYDDKRMRTGKYKGWRKPTE